MVIRMMCPYCSKVIATDDDKYGQQIECSWCKAPVTVPERPVAKTATLLPEEPAAPAPVAAPPAAPAPVAAPPAAPAPAVRAHQVLPGSAGDVEIAVVHPVWRGYPGQVLLAAALVAVFVAGLVLGAGKWSLVALAAAGVAALRTWLLTLATRYRLTSERLFWREGILSRKNEEMELYRITDVKLEQGIIETLLKVGTVVVISTDATTPTLRLMHLANPEEFKEKLRRAYRAEAARMGVRRSEFMHGE
jgi:membrane protein YdbS with pleckstrin-like domain